jgi:4-amino-4-deoxy-L-arabinose transferase-like glycosyltransferase
MADKQAPNAAFLIAPKAPLDLWWLFGLALLLLGVGYGLRDPWPADEPRFALIGRDIWESGRWFLPHRGPELYAEKPPVFLWLQALAYGLTGSVRASFLLPSMLAALGTLVLHFDLARRLWSRKAAFWSSLALLLCVQFTLQGRTAQIDAVLAFCTTLGLYGLLRHLLLGPAWGWYVIGGIATGVGVITKGTGFLPWLLMIPYVFARWRQWPGLPRFEGGWRWALGPLGMLLPILLWLLPLLWMSINAPTAELLAYRDDLLLRQTVTRYANAWHHHKPFWYFVVDVIPVFWLPFSLLAVWAAPAWRRRLQRNDARILLPLAWIALVVLFFSLSPGKRHVYILPALPALALAFTPLLPGLLRRLAVQRAGAIVTLLLGLVIAGAAATALFGRPGFAVKVETDNGVAPWDWLLAVGLVGIVVSLMLWRRGWAAFGLFMLAVWSGYGLFGFPQMTDARSGKALMQRVAKQQPAEVSLGLVGVPEQLLLQAQGDVRAFGFKRPLEEQKALAYAWLKENPTHWLLMSRIALDACIEREWILDVGISNRRHWFLIPPRAVDVSCIDAEGYRAATSP